MKIRALSLRLIVLAVPGLLILGGCASEDSPSDAPDPVSSADLVGRTFVFGAAQVTGDHQPPAGGTGISLTFTDKGIAGTGGCNRLLGGATVSDGALLVDDLASTEMACDKQLMKQDQWLTRFLTSGPSIQLEGDTLTLVSGTTTLTLTDETAGQVTPDLVGTTWRLNSLVDQDTASSVPARVTSTLTFTGEGTVSIHPGCNTGGGDYTVDGDVIHFGAIALTMMACEGSQGDVEAQVMKVLQGDLRFSITGQNLTLVKGNNSLVYVASGTDG